MVDYKEIVDKVRALLIDELVSKKWEKLYFNDADNIIEKANILECKFKGYQFGRCNLKKYTNMSLLKGSTKESEATIQLRYKGVIVAKITSNRADEVIVEPDEKVIKSGWVYGDQKFNWNSHEGIRFRKFVSSHNPNDFRSNKKEITESFIESTIIDDLTQYGLENKIPGMTAIKMGKCAFQFPTAIKASDFYNGGLASIKYIDSNTRGGNIDILGRIKSIGITNTLAIIEVKDFKENLYSKETFEKVMGQAVAYTTFIRELLRSKNTNADKWWNIFGFNNKYGIPEKLILKTIVAMPREDVSNSEIEEVFSQRNIRIGNDQIELNCLLYDFDKTYHTVKKYCYSEECLIDN